MVFREEQTLKRLGRDNRIMVLSVAMLESGIWMEATILDTVVRQKDGTKTIGMI